MEAADVGTIIINLQHWPLKINCIYRYLYTQMTIGCITVSMFKRTNSKIWISLDFGLNLQLSYSYWLIPIVYTYCFFFVWTQERNEAALRIQSLVRKFLQRRRAERQRLAAVFIQAVWRCYVARRKLRLQKEAQLRLQRLNAAVIIQVV